MSAGTILLSLHHKENARLLAEVLAAHYTVVPSDPQGGLEGPFDLGILDGPSLDRLWGRVKALREAADPVFLPFLLVASRQDMGMVTRGLWQHVDELILTPIERRELQARVANLLRARALSLTLRDQNEALARLERSAFHGVPVGLLRTLPTGQILEVNPALLEILGYPDADALCRVNAAELYADPDARTRMLAHLARDGVVRNFETQLRRRDGRAIWVRLSTRIVRGPAGEFLEGAVVDFTAEKLADEARRESEERFRQLAENIGEVFWLTDPEKTRMIYINPAYERVWGRKCHELYAAPGAWLDAIHPDDRDRVHQAALHKQAHGEYDEIYRIQRPDGETRWIRDRAFPVRDPSGKVYRVAGVATDITKLKEAEAAVHRQREVLHQTEKLAAMGGLLAGVAHELNNPLSVILGLSTLLYQTVPEGPPRDRAKRLAEAAERCARIVRNFLALARQRPPVREQVLLNDVVREAVELVAYHLRADNVMVALDLAPDLPPVWADPHQLHQVVVNLVTNAHHAMRQIPPPRRLTLATRFDPTGGRTRLEVEDTGPGIPLEIQGRIFEPFFTTKPPGRAPGWASRCAMGSSRGMGEGSGWKAPRGRGLASG